MRVIGAKTEEKPTQKAEPKGPAFTIIKRLPVGVAVEQAKRTAARASADLGRSPMTAPPCLRRHRGRLYLHPASESHRHAALTHWPHCSERRRCTPHYPSRGVSS